ncbi:MAG: hypothetical protein ACRBB0_11015 [Pelagimonas sp.]|uniref:hypothetical protein n=1 Tax=Pelagimonas sp. TaxID=2073170 RepID=UPI003D6C45E9
MGVDDDDDSSDTSSDPETPETPEDSIITTLDTPSYVGTDGNDTTDLDARPDGFNDVSLDAGDGDDLLDLSDNVALNARDTYENALWNDSTVDGGQGMTPSVSRAIPPW